MPESKSIEQLVAEAVEATRREERRRTEQEIQIAVDETTRKFRSKLEEEKHYWLELARKGWEAEVWARLPQLASREHTPKAHRHPTTTHTGGADCMFDYLISECWDGVEGQVHTSLTGCDFKVYSHPALAFADAVTNRATSGQDTVFYICSGDYLIDAQMTLSPPTSGGWVIVGTGMAYSTKLLADASTYSMFSVSNQGGAQNWVEFRNLGFDTNGETTVTCIDFAAARRTNIRDCLFYLDNSTNIGIEMGGNTELSSISGCAVQGTAGTGITCGVGNSNWSVMTSTFDGITIGIDIKGSANVDVAANQFRCTTGVNFSSSTAGWTVAISANDFKCTTGVNVAAQGSSTTAKAIAVTGNAFDCDTCGVDFSGIGAAAMVAGASITGNAFFNDAGAIGIRGDTRLHASIATGNTFWEFTSGNEIVDWSGNGNEAMHNVSAEVTGSTITKQALTDIGSPVGHSTTAVAAPNDATYVVATDQDATLPNSRLLTEGTGIDIADGGAAGNITLSVDLSELTWIKEEGTALPTQRGTLDFRGTYQQAVDDGVDDTAIFGGYAHYDAIVDNNQYNALATTVPVYTTLQAAVDAGHISILFRSSTDAATTDTATCTTGGGSTSFTTTESWTVNQWVGAVVTIDTATDSAIVGEKRVITSNTATVLNWASALPGSTTAGDTCTVSLGVVIESGDAVNYILGDDPNGSALNCPLTISRASVLVSNMAFSGQDVVLDGVGATIQACRVIGAATAMLTGAGAGVIACAFVGASGKYAVSLSSTDQRVVSNRFTSGSTTTGVIQIVTTSTNRWAIVGNSWTGGTETGWFLTGLVITLGTFNGNVLSIPLTTTGVIGTSVVGGGGHNALNISGNVFVYSTVNSGATETCISDVGRAVITGNNFIASNIASNTTLKWITTSATVTGVVVANNLYAHGSITSGSQMYGCEANAGGLIMASNVFVAQGSSTGNATGLNALALGYVFQGNEFVTITSTSMRNWIPVTNSGGTAAISGVSSIKGNGSGLVDIQAYRYT